MLALVEIAGHYKMVFQRLLARQRGILQPLVLNEEEKMAVYLMSGVAVEFKAIEKDGLIVLLIRTSKPAGVTWDGMRFHVVEQKG
jgi:dTDP-4-dehydrorhamnose 3,5-epimerase-like enzyme